MIDLLQAFGVLEVQLCWSLIAHGRLAAGWVFLVNGVMFYIYFRWGYSRMQLFYSLSFFLIFFGGMILGSRFPGVTAFLTRLSLVKAAIFTILTVMIVLPLLWRGAVVALSRADLH
ncbi:hypothetical protein [Calderihabitans maritimus]|uniref:Uncharacterized protein n=1 Tax=Calderihabitans maritimus TaxID=1246530 RepID=A0A1Z5HP54_9FIRM|nr:hypothetical protein [Calderihabitans maritimus]GAW91294.1 hypothetical protein KKC1_04560 [Calderihabitans maritimus]